MNKPYLVKTVPDEEYTDGIVFIEELTDAAEKDFDPFFEEAQEEKLTDWCGMGTCPPVPPGVK